MRSYLVLLFLVSQLKLVAAFSTSGAWERLYFYYCYQLDDQNAVKTISPKCYKQAAGRRCTFQEFVRYLNAGDTIDYTKIANVDLTRPQDTVDKIISAKATGAYNCQHMFEGDYGQDDVTGNMRRLESWLYKQTTLLSGLSDTAKLNFQLVSKSVATQRKANRNDAYVELYKKYGYTLIFEKVPLYPGSLDLVDSVNVVATLNDEANKNNGLTVAKMREFKAEFDLKDSPGHVDLITSATTQAEKLTLNCPAA